MTPPPGNIGKKLPGPSRLTDGSDQFFGKGKALHSPPPRRGGRPEAVPTHRTRRRRVLDARPDALDFRDRMFEPTLVEVPPEHPLKDYLNFQVPILDQGQEGACTGFGLATVVNYLLRAFLKPQYRVSDKVSPRMLYEMARRYDEWPGEDYEGSSARGAMKGWHKHGVCRAATWPYLVSGNDVGELTAERSIDAMQRPLGAYLRVNHRDLVAMHSAIAEVGILYATSQVHAGWDDVGADGLIAPNERLLGGHAFAIVAYDRQGFWIQNSWGADWGRGGFARITYDDWLANGTDVWVARLGVPVESHNNASTAQLTWSAAGNPLSLTQEDLRPHIVSLGNNGALRPDGTWGSTPDSVREIFEHYLPQATSGWKKKRILLYAHGGLVPEQAAIQRLAEFRKPLLDSEVYPISFIWQTDYWSTLKNILKDALSRRTTGGLLDSAKDFMLDRADDMLEPLARALTGKAEWSEMKENALAATISKQGGARLVLKHLQAFIQKNPGVELHLIGHSAGSILHAPIVQSLTTTGKIASGPLKGETGYGLRLTTLTLWAPACTVAVFKEFYAPALSANRIADFGLFTLTDKAEQDDNCASIYNKSLLYLVSNAFEERFRIPIIRPDGEPILGMEKFIAQDKALRQLITTKGEWILAPNTSTAGPRKRSDARHHGDFDNDPATLQSALTRILGKSNKSNQAFAQFHHHRATDSLHRRREAMSLTTGDLRAT